LAKLEAILIPWVGPTKVIFGKEGLGWPEGYSQLREFKAKLGLF